MNKGTLLLAGFLLPAAGWTAAPPQKQAAPKKPAAVANTNGIPDDLKRLIARAPRAADYPNAAKATLLDLADISVRPDGSARTRTRMVIKVFNERGRDEAKVNIPFHGQDETVTLVHARTVKPDGTVLSVKPAEVMEQGVGDGEMYTDARTKSFILPAVGDDCVIDYEYVTDQKRSQMPGHFWTNWMFQGGIDPVVSSRLTLTAPKTLPIKHDLRNTDVQTVTKENAADNTVTYIWEAKNVAPLNPEPMMPGPKRFLPMLAVSTVPSWQKIADWYWDLAKGRADADPTLKALAARLTKDKTTPEEKAKAIFYYVEEKTQYVAIELGVGAFQPRPASDVAGNQYGDCKDMATLLVALLREAGITAHPVLLGAGNPQSVSDDLPSPGAFNHAICLAEIDGKKFWLDATAQISSWGDIPGGDRGVEALVIREGKGTFETIPHAAPADNRVDQSVKLTLAPDGSATGTVTLSGAGDINLGLRYALTNLPPDRHKGFVENMAQRIGPNARVTSYKISDYRNKDVPVSISYEVQFPSWAKPSGDLLLFKARAEQTAEAGSSPFRAETRTHAITQNAAALAMSQLEVTLPPGFSILSAPQPASVSGALGSLSRTVDIKENRLTIRVKGENLRADVPASQYQAVRKYYNDYLRASDESVVIKKGN